MYIYMCVATPCIYTWNLLLMQQPLPIAYEFT